MPSKHDLSTASTVFVAAKVCPVCGLRAKNGVDICPADKLTLVAEGDAPCVTLWEKYELLGSLGSGGMGIVYKARLLSIDKIVAIKMLHAHMDSAVAVQRFQQEGKALGLLSHENIVGVMDLGITERDRPYMVLEYFEGRTLSDLLADNQVSMSNDRALQIFIQIADGLAHAHKRKLLHRDIKPSNILITTNDDSSDLVKILDFGIAKFMTDEAERRNLTRTGEAIGSPLYMSPEQILGQPVDERSDLYSLGCLLYEVIAGVPPFMGSSTIDTMSRHLNEAPLTLNQALLGTKEVLPGLEDVVARLLAKNPDDRYPDMDTLRTDLRKLARREVVLVSHFNDKPAKGKETSEFWNHKALILTAMLSTMLVSIPAALCYFKLLHQGQSHTVHVMEKLPQTLCDGNNFSKAVEDLRHYQSAEPVLAGAVNVSDNDLRQLQTVTDIKITRIELKHSPDLTDEGLKYISHFPLVELNLNETTVKSLAPLKNNKTLLTLSLCSTPVADAACQVIGTISNLERLNLQDTNITDTGLRSLHTLKQLQQLNITHCSDLTPEGVEQLIKALPNCNIQVGVLQTLMHKVQPLWDKGGMLYKRKRYAEALAQYRQAEECFDSYERKLGMKAVAKRLFTLVREANCYKNMDDPQSAYDAFRKGLNVAKETTMQGDAFNKFMRQNANACYIGMAQYQERNGLWSELEKSSSEAIQWIGSELRRYAFAELGLALMNLKRYPEACNALKSACTLFDQQRDFGPTHVITCYRCADTLILTNQIGPALIYYQQCARMAEDLNINSDVYGCALIKIGNCQSTLGNSQAAISSFSKAVQMSERIPSLACIHKLALEQLKAEKAKVH